MDPLTLGLLMGGTSLATGGLNYLGSRQAAGAQSAAAQQSGLYGLIAQQQAIQQQQQQQKQAVDALTNYGTQAQNALQAGQTGALGGLEKYYGQGVGFQQPYMQAGEQATNQLAQLFGQGGAYTQQPTYEQLQMDPGYAFRMQQGEQAMLNAARGGGLAGSGAALKAATRYGQEAGSQEYQSAYNRFMANRAAATQGLQSLAGLGAGAAQTATGLAGTTGANVGNVYTGTGQNIAQAALNTGGNIANAYTGNLPTMAALTGANPYGTAAENAAQARASGYVGGTSALGNALQGGVNGMLAYSMLNRMPQQPTGTYQFGGQNVPYF